MESEDKAYKENSKFWIDKGDKITLVGDFLGRVPSIELINPIKKEKILDAGCGNGFISRKLALRGSKVYGCDRNKEMLNGAIELEAEDSLRIKYQLADITNLPYENNFFDKIACIAVLIHNSPEECKKFFSEANRTLKDNGLLFISLMHPYLFSEDSPCRKKETSWVNYEPIEKISLENSQKFKENYYNSKREMFSSIVWYHPKENLLNLLKDSGFEIISTHEQFMTEETLKNTNHSGPIGYPAFLQIVAQVKPKIL